MPPPGAPGAATGAIAIGTAATSRSITLTISIVTTISTATSIAKAATGSTIRNTAGMHLTGTGKRRINSGVRVLVAQAALVIDRAASGEPVAQEALAGLAAQVAQEALAELVVRVVELELSQEEAEQVLGPVAAEQELAPVVAEQEHVQGEAELELVRAAVPLRIKSVIAPHHRGLVPVLGAGDLAAEVETTREPVAAEAVIAWEVAE